MTDEEVDQYWAEVDAILASLDAVDWSDGSSDSAAADEANEDTHDYDDEQLTVQDYAEVIGADALALAEKWVRTVGPLAEYEPADHYAPTPEEYHWGSRDAHTARSVAAQNRHERTNYEVLIDRLDRYEPADRVIYDAIHHQVRILTDPEYDPWCQAPSWISSP